jgi:hypothetical protein
MATNQTQARRNNQTKTSHSGFGRVLNAVTHPSIPATGLFFAAIALLLLADSAIRAPSALEFRVVDSVQGLEPGFMSGMLGLINDVTGLGFALAAAAIVVTMAVYTRSWGTAIIAFMLPIVAILLALIERLWQGWSIPGMSMMERFIPSFSIPGISSVQIAGAVLIYGLLFFVARKIGFTPIRLAIQGASITVMLLAGLSQLWTGALMPTDVLIALSIGGLILLPLITIAKRVDAACGDIPAISAGEVQIDESTPHAKALTSTVVFNDSTVSKIYRPGFLPRAIYWLAFQAEFPYMRNQAALRAAVERRNLIGQLTEYWYGSNHVARAIRVDRVSGRYAITSEFVDGSEPHDRESAKRFLEDLVQKFEEAGLPTWQIDPRQPRSIDNVIETADGEYRVVDLESGLVAPLASIQTWRRAFQRGLVPMYDDVFFDVTRSYIQEHEADMRAKYGSNWVQSLYVTLDATERQTQAWHDSEPRVWSRLFGRRRSTDDAENRQHWAIQWFEDAIASWRDEGRISASEARELQQKVRSPQFLSVMPHFGVHLSSSVLLRFPLGSIARVAYTAFNLLHISLKFAFRRINRQEWREGVGIHSPLVLLISAIPGFGAFAYLVSKPIRSDHLMLCIGLDAVMLKLPWDVYERTRARWLVTQTPAVLDRFASATSRNLKKVPKFAWSDEHRTGTDPNVAYAPIETTANGPLRSMF